ncbi:MAG: zinc-ribbon domain-containing protein [Spirochaetaceae bacterium]|nr:MAG: zinc-ribbon domain-containing protein [Spirochaetaceae bacterium]
MKQTRRKRPNSSAGSVRFYCEHCGKEVDSKDILCPHCGKVFSSVKCPKCHHSGRQSSFSNGCPVCGYTGTAEKAAPQVPLNTTHIRLPKRKEASFFALFLVMIIIFTVFAGLYFKP